jgi:hypothetical protein
VRDDGRHAAQVGYRVRVGPPAELLQLGQQSQQNLLVEVFGLGPLARAVRVEVELVADDAFNDRPGVGVDES